MPNARFLTRFSVALFAASALTACGGGGEAERQDTDRFSIFAPPSGILCSIKVDGICVEPTSSSTTPQQLLATLLDPDGPEIDLLRFGNSFTFHSKVAFTPESSYVLVESEFNYDSAEKSLRVGRNQIKVGGKTYAFNRTVDDGDLEFRASEADGIKIIPPTSEFPFVQFDQLYGTTSHAGTMTNFLGTIGGDIWQNHFGLLSDSADANEPSSGKIQYSGFVAFKAGDGAPLDPPFLNSVDAVCPVSLTLSTDFGKLVTSEVKCNARGTDLHLSLGVLDIKDSRVYNVLGHDAHGSVTGPAQFHAGDPDAEPPILSMVFASHKIGGAIYGSGAGAIVIQGSGTRGSFKIHATRQ